MPGCLNHKIYATIGFSGKVFDFLEGLLLPYTIVAKANSVVREAVMEITDWIEITAGIEIGETVYRAHDWKKARRVVAVRQRLEDRPKAREGCFPNAPHTAIRCSLQPGSIARKMCGGTTTNGLMLKTESKNGRAISSCAGSVLRHGSHPLACSNDFQHH